MLTVKPKLVVPLFPSARVTSPMLIVAASSLVMVPVPVDVPRVTLYPLAEILLRFSVKVSESSTLVSPLTETITVWVV